MGYPDYETNCRNCGEPRDEVNENCGGDHPVPIPEESINIVTADRTPAKPAVLPEVFDDGVICDFDRMHQNGKDMIYISRRDGREMFISHQVLKGGGSTAGHLNQAPRIEGLKEIDPQAMLRSIVQNTKPTVPAIPTVPDFHAWLECQPPDQRAAVKVVLSDFYVAWYHGDKK